MKSYIIEGGSTAHGTGGGEDGMQSWAAELDATMCTDFTSLSAEPVQVLNRAKPGNTIVGINVRWKNYGEAFMANNGVTRRSIRILSVGQNESRIAPDRLQPIIKLGRFATELKQFSDESERLNMQTVYVGPQLADESKCRPMETGWFIENDLVEEYADVIKQRAQQDGMPYVDVAELFSTMPTAYLDLDGRHPNATGHHTIFQGVKYAIQSLNVHQ